VYAEEWRLPGLSVADMLWPSMQVQPWCAKAVWTRALARPLEAGDTDARRTLLALLQPAKGGVMWRTAKSSVAQELGIPEQMSSVQRLALSAVERHAYRR
jgi:SNF2-related domain